MRERIETLQNVIKKKFLLKESNTSADNLYKKITEKKIKSLIEKNALNENSENSMIELDNTFHPLSFFDKKSEDNSVDETLYGLQKRHVKISDHT